MFVGQYISKEQHAYLPGRGVPTATSALTKELEDPKNRYAMEFDLKGAFPSIRIPATTELMKNIGFPPMLADYIKAMSIVTRERVDLAPVEKQGVLPEPKFERQQELVKRLPEGWLNPITSKLVFKFEEGHQL